MPRHTLDEIKATSTFDLLWGEEDAYLIGDWQGLIRSAANPFFGATDSVPELAAKDFEASLGEGPEATHDAAFWWAYKSFQTGAILGAALIRTWPAVPEDLDTWISRAAAYAEGKPETDIEAQLAALYRKADRLLAEQAKRDERKEEAS